MLRVFGCMVASRGGYRMARGRHYAKLSLSNAPRLSFSDLCILLFLFLSLCRFLFVCVFVFFFCSHWSLVDVPLIFFCPADHVPDWQAHVLLGMVEARSVNVKKTTTTTAEPVSRDQILRQPCPVVMVIHINKLYIHTAVVTHLCTCSSEPCTNVHVPK